MNKEVFLFLLIATFVLLFIGYLLSLTRRACRYKFGEQHKWIISDDEQSAVCKDCGLQLEAVKRWRIKQ